MKYSFGWADVRKMFSKPNGEKTSKELYDEHLDNYVHAIYAKTIGTSSGNVNSSTTASMPWDQPSGGTTSDKDLGSFSITAVENGFSITHTKAWKSKSFIASDLESLRDIIVTTLVSNELDK